MRGLSLDESVDNENGRPAYHPKDLLKLYIYGYLNKVRSSRDLEKESKRNIEAIWLIKGLSPDHNTIPNFRSDNRKLIESEIEKHEKRKQGYQQIQDQLDKTGENQLSTSDPESRQMITRNNITEVAYNVQTSVDAKNNIPIDYKVTNTNDSKAMGNMLQRAKTILRSNEFTALYDKGYHTGSEFKKTDDSGIEVMVAIPTVATQAPDPDYNVENFTYNKEKDIYVCPLGKRS